MMLRGVTCGTLVPQASREARAGGIDWEHAMRTLRPVLLLMMLCAFVLPLPGCITPQDKSKQLARVAKDWCLTIRASQVMPVYPLTRDLRPGDIFLTTTPIGAEVAQFESAGFLPFDVHLKRLNTDDAIKAFYATRLADGAEFPGPGTTWTDLPAGAFPTYTVEISRSGGLNLAIPVQGIPVGFGYLGAAAATATVTLTDAETAGLDLATLQPLVDTWAKENRSWLAAYATDPDDPAAVPAFLRIVARIYRVSEVSVHLDDASRSGAEVAAGIELPKPDPGAPSATQTAAEQYDAVAKNLSTTLSQQFGGKLRVIGASRRSVTLAEKFAAPMVIGYIAYDCRILEGGALSAPVPSFQRLTGRADAGAAVLNSAALVQAWYAANERERVPAIRQWMSDNLKPADGSAAPGAVEFLSDPKWDSQRRQMIRDLGVLAR